MSEHHPIASPRLTFCPETLPSAAYLDPNWFAREMRTIWARNWVSAGRLADLSPGTMRRVKVGAAEVILCRGGDGALSAFHNACRHRGAELCAAQEQPMGRLISCPYHAWSYAGDDGRLVSTGYAVPTDDFRREDYGLHKVATRVWAGYVLLNIAKTPGDLAPDMGLNYLDHWPMDSLITGHRMVRDLACNWKVFWENYNECLHCPGIHPELCDLVPVYSKGVMGVTEAHDWTPDQTVGPNLKAGAHSWTPTGAACGPEFAGLTAEERHNGYNFVTVMPSMFVVAHVDYVRSVRLEPLGPESTRLTAEWHFSAETLAQPGFDAAEVAAFARMVMDQDGDAVEVNQRGLRSPAHQRGRLMPEEYELHRFHNWVLTQMNEEG
jgi:Rieske 2Fe-2S family protein